MTRPVRIGNSSGFYGDRDAATREMVEGGPIDVLTGDYLAELTMLILWKMRQKDPGAGYARSVLGQLESVLGTCLDRGIKIVNNAGGLNPGGLADELGKLAERLGLHPKIAYVTGDDLLPRLDELTAAGETFTHLDTGQTLAETASKPVTANAYLGGWGIAAALEAGADIVVCPRVTDASLVVGPAAWWHGWQRDDFDALAGAVLAGHVIECGPQATGGNYSFLDEVVDRRYPGFPIAEVAADGSSVITKHPDTGGLVSVGTVTAQLLYEIAEPAYRESGRHRARRHRDADAGRAGSRGDLRHPGQPAAGHDEGRDQPARRLPQHDDARADRPRHRGEGRVGTLDELFGILGGRGAVRRGRRQAAAVRYTRRADERAGHGAPPHHRQGSGPPEGRPPVRERDDGTRARWLRRLPHDDAADRRDRVRGLLAGAGARVGRRSRGRATRTAPRITCCRRRPGRRSPSKPSRSTMDGRRRRPERRSARSAAPDRATRAATRTSASGRAIRPRTRGCVRI